MKWLSLLIIALSLLAAGCAKSDGDARPEGARSFARGASQGENEKNFAGLMAKYAQGVVKPQPWVGYWWPYSISGIAAGHRDPARQGPADKYDVAYRNFLKASGIDVSSSYESAGSWERIHHGPGLGVVEGWWGHCNGWAAAALMVPEPRQERVIDGVTFGVRDQKALLAEAWLEFTNDFIGDRVYLYGDTSSPAFWDVVPAQFHLVLANIVGKQSRGLIIDRHTGDQVWNQPLVAYQFDPIEREDYLGPHPDYPDVYRVNVTARIWWANDDVEPDAITPEFDMEKLHGTWNDPNFRGRKLRYELWLDGPIVFDNDGHMKSSGDILLTREGGRYVGGVWKNGLDPARLVHTHPDFMWMPHGMRAAERQKNPRLDDVWIQRNLVAGAASGG